MQTQFGFSLNSPGLEYMIVIEGMQARVLEVLQAVSDIVERRRTLPILANVLIRGNTITISDGFPESGGGGSSVVDCDDCSDAGGASPEVAAADDDDDGGDADSDPDGRPPHKTPITQPGTASASKMRTRAPRQPAGQNPAFQVIGITEFDLAESIGMSVEFLRKDRSGKRLIPFYRIGSAIRYNPARVTEALVSLEVGGYAPKPKARKARQSTLTAG